MKINILLCDTFADRLPEEIPDYVSMFRKLFGMIDDTVCYEIFDVCQDIYPVSLHRNELYLIPGSRASAYDDTPWIKSLIGFIRKMYSEKVKMAGVCFGHQIIAQALGGKVERAQQGWGTGVRTSMIIDHKALKFFPDMQMNLLYNHHDQVTELPPHAKCFAVSDFCNIEGFYIKDNTLTFQGHPEYTPEYNRYLLLNHSSDEQEEVKTMALASLNRKTDSLAAAKWMYDELCMMSDEL
jgi:GMP synthase-like glutamine amidotransferase